MWYYGLRRIDYKKQVATGGTVLQIFDKKDNLNEDNKKNINWKRFILKKRTFIVLIWMSLTKTNILKSLLEFF